MSVLITTNSRNTLSPTHTRFTTYPQLVRRLRKIPPQLNWGNYKYVYQEIYRCYFFSSDWKRVGLQVSLQLDSTSGSLLDQIFQIKEQLLFIRIYKLYSREGISLQLIIMVMNHLFGGVRLIRDLDQILKDRYSLLSHVKAVYEENQIRV